MTAFRVPSTFSICSMHACTNSCEEISFFFSLSWASAMVSEESDKGSGRTKNEKRANEKQLSVRRRRLDLLIQDRQGTGCQHLIGSRSIRSYLILTERIGEPGHLGRRRDVLGIHFLQNGDVFQNLAELGGEFLDF